tara:strand:+ start:11183 stop:11380 length:198 start_codon:yes stop_codon:yes gene_type:complete
MVFYLFLIFIVFLFTFYDSQQETEDSLPVSVKDNVTLSLFFAIIWPLTIIIIILSIFQNLKNKKS